MNEDIDRQTMNIINQNDASSTISSFYAEKSIFITGASGFMGKVLVEKLLRSCSSVKCIYILLRAKKNVEPSARLDELIQSKIFDRIREIDAELLKKIVVIPGDIILPGLGISDENIELLCREVAIVFHSAATVKFDEPMRTSINFNALGTRNMLELCGKMKLLEAFIHVSTAYSNCDRQDIEECFYPLNVPYKKIIELNEWMDDDTLTAIAPHLLGNRPNTYTFTKALAETLLLNEKGSLPVAIVRPSIVTAAWREPYPGWIDNINGPTGMILATGKGLLRTMLHESNASADMIPVDMVINLMITVAWYTATHKPSNISIYNCTSGSLNQLKWCDVERYVFEMSRKYPSNIIFRYPSGSFKESRFYNKICTILDHKLPAYLLDSIRLLCWKKPIMNRIYTKLNRAIQALEYFTTRGWNFSSKNVIHLLQELQGIDRSEFDFDVRTLNWSDYWKNYVLGIRKFILKEDDSTLLEAQKNLKRMYYIRNISITLAATIIPFILFVNSKSYLNESVSEYNLNSMQSSSIDDNQLNNISSIISSTSSNFDSQAQTSIWRFITSYLNLPLSSNIT